MEEPMNLSEYTMKELDSMYQNLIYSKSKDSLIQHIEEEIKKRKLEELEGEELEGEEEDVQ